MREVSLPRLLLLTLRHWRSMFLFGLILAVLLAGMKVLREYKNRGVSNVAHEEYLAAMEIYNASVEAYSGAIEKFQTKIDNKQKYFNESLLMQIDPHNECVSTISMVVKTPGMEEADTSAAQAGQTQSPAIVNASNVVHAYTDFISSNISFDKIAAEAGVTEQSVRELVLVTTDQYHFSSVFKVQARSMDSPAGTSWTGSPDSETRIVSPMPSSSNAPMPTALFTMPTSAVPDSVTPICWG